MAHQLKVERSKPCGQLFPLGCFSSGIVGRAKSVVPSKGYAAQEVGGVQEEVLAKTGVGQGLTIGNALRRVLLSNLGKEMHRKLSSFFISGL